jgi:N-dimethylarginine dimethylaminohydrolase
MKRTYEVDGTLGDHEEFLDETEHLYHGIKITRVREQAKSVERFVMCRPEYLSTAIKNNVFMKGAPIDVPRACQQYDRIKRAITTWDVPVLELPPTKGCQDQTYTANIGVAIQPYVVLANMSAAGRDCEEPVAKKQFEDWGYQVIQPPYDFEGEADFKKWKPGHYFGSWGQFTEQKALDWIADKTGCTVIPIHVTSKKLYHLDCDLFVIDEQNFMVNPAGIDKASLRELEKWANLVIVPNEVADTGITNCVRIPGQPIILSGMLTAPELPAYRKSVEWLNKNLGDAFDLTCLFFDIDEADKSGADISCMVMHLDF